MTRGRSPASSQTNCRVYRHPSSTHCAASWLGRQTGLTCPVFRALTFSGSLVCNNTPMPPRDTLVPRPRRYTNALPPLSYSRGAAVPLLQKTIAQALAAPAARSPDREALVVGHQTIRLTWSDLDREATRVARGLAGLGLAPGDRAGIWASNCVEWILMQHAAARAAVVLVNVNPAYRSHELRYVLQKSRIRALFLRERDARADYRAILDDSRDVDSLPLDHVFWLADPSCDAMLA